MMKTRILALLTLLPLFACQSAPVRPPTGDRNPASDPVLDPKVAEVAKRYALGALGIYAEGLLLERKLKRLQLQPALVSPVMPEPHFVPGSVTLSSLSSLATLPNIIILGSDEGLDAMSIYPTAEKLTHAIFKTRTRWAVSATSGVAGAASSGGAFTSFITYSAPLDTRDNSKADPAVSLNFVFRHAELEDFVRTDAARKNAEIQAAFESELGETAKSIADRMALVYALADSERVMLHTKLKSRILSDFQSAKNWQAGQPVQIDVQKILRKVVPNADDRTNAVTTLIRESSALTRMPASGLNRVLIRTALGETVTSLSELNASVLRDYQKYAEDRDPAFRKLAAEYYAYSRKIESYQRKVTLFLDLKEAP